LLLSRDAEAAGSTKLAEAGSRRNFLIFVEAGSSFERIASASFVT